MGHYAEGVQDVELIEQIAIALALGLAGGLAARRLRLSPIVGYLAAGIVIGPFTPGYTADMAAITELAELGVIFLMFGVGLHFNVRDLTAVKAVVLPGATFQMIAVAGAGVAVGWGFDLGWREGLALGLAIAISSTVVSVRRLEEEGLTHSAQGRVIIGWLVVQDLATVLILAILPALASGDLTSFLRDASVDLAVAAAFLGVLLIVGARVVPWALGAIAMAGSRELFILAVVAAALGIAAGAAALGLSLALGAFVAGVVMSERETSQQAAADVVPLREAFAVLFFVAVGMLLDPAVLRSQIGLVLAVAGVIIIFKGLLSAALTAASPYPARTALLTGAGLAQAGEFSFVIALQALDIGLLDEGTYNVILAAAVISIVVNPLTFRGIPLWEAALKKLGPVWRWSERQGPLPASSPRLSNHVVIAGYGRVGQLLGQSLTRLGIPFVVVDSDLRRVRDVAAAGISAIWGDSGNPDVLGRASAGQSRMVVVCVPDASTSMLCVAGARRANQSIPILVRARSGDEIPELRRLGATSIVVPEYEGGLEVMRQAVAELGVDAAGVLALSDALRDAHYNAEP